MSHLDLILETRHFVKYAESYGAHGYRPKSVEEFEATLEKCVNSKGVHLIDLAVDYSLNYVIN